MSTRTKKPAKTRTQKMSKSAARAEGSAKTDRLRKAALAEISGRLAGGKQDHEVPSEKEVLVALEPVETGFEQHRLVDEPGVVFARAGPREAHDVQVGAVAALVADLAPREHGLQAHRAGKRKHRLPAVRGLLVERHDFGDEPRHGEVAIGERAGIARRVLVRSGRVLARLRRRCHEAR